MFKPLERVKDYWADVRSWAIGGTLTIVAGWLAGPTAFAALTAAWTYALGWQAPLVFMAACFMFTLGVIALAHLQKARYYTAARRAMIGGATGPARELLAKGRPPELEVRVYAGAAIELEITNNGGDAVLRAEGKIAMVDGAVCRRRSPYAMLWLHHDTHDVVKGRDFVVPSGGKARLLVASFRRFVRLPHEFLNVEIHGDRSVVEEYDCSRNTVTALVLVELASTPTAARPPIACGFRSNRELRILELLDLPPGDKAHELVQGAASRPVS